MKSHSGPTRFLSFLFCLITFFIIPLVVTCQERPALGRVRIVIHGGAGTILKKNMTPQTESDYRAALTQALNAGYSVMLKGGTSLDAVQAAINYMEDSPLFNAGKGAVFTHEGTNELDASIMNGANLMAGAVAGVRHIKNPITCARLVMEKSPHVMMAGEGAEKFAMAHGMDTVPQSYFYTERRWNQLQQMLKEERDADSVARRNSPLPADTSDRRHGTVGCVALDEYGNLAAGTSTGGLTGKRFGRIGDAPVIGAGTYADNRTCGVSCTGDGEYFLRLNVARDIASMMEYKGMDVVAAGDTVIAKVTRLGGTGGLIAMDREGRIAMPFNTSGMYRAWIDESGKPVVRIFKDE
jgi:L-asparaginase / beta-aspartyl-peptidase